MLKFDEICDLIRLVGSSGVESITIERGGDRIKVKGRPAPEMVAAPIGTLPQTAIAVQPLAAPPGQEDSAPAEDLHIVTSPIVGTFYRAPNPDADPFVKNGEPVEKGQVLCIVEAMKLMNEIESDMGGTIAKILVENAEPVEYGQPLFAVRTD